VVCAIRWERRASPSEADSTAVGVAEGVRVDLGVSEVLTAFVTTPATVYGNDDDRALQTR
jgi:hypothetical protein